MLISTVLLALAASLVRESEAKGFLRRTYELCEGLLQPAHRATSNGSSDLSDWRLKRQFYGVVNNTISSLSSLKTIPFLPLSTTSVYPTGTALPSLTSTSPASQALSSTNIPLQSTSAATMTPFSSRLTSASSQMSPLVSQSSASLAMAQASSRPTGSTSNTMRVSSAIDSATQQAPQASTQRSESGASLVSGTSIVYSSPIGVKAVESTSTAVVLIKGINGPTTMTTDVVVWLVQATEEAKTEPQLQSSGHKGSVPCIFVFLLSVAGALA